MLESHERRAAEPPGSMNGPTPPRPRNPAEPLQGHAPRGQSLGLGINPLALGSAVLPCRLSKRLRLKTVSLPSRDADRFHTPVSVHAQVVVLGYSQQARLFPFRQHRCLKDGRSVLGAGYVGPSSKPGQGNFSLCSVL